MRADTKRRGHGVNIEQMSDEACRRATAAEEALKPPCPKGDHYTGTPFEVLPRTLLIKKDGIIFQAWDSDKSCLIQTFTLPWDSQWLNKTTLRMVVEAWIDRGQLPFA